MSRTGTVGLAAIVAIAASAVSPAAHVEQGTTGRDRPVHERPARPIAPPRPIPPSEVGAYVRTLEVRPPIRFRGMALVPLVARSVRNATRYESLDEALRLGHLVIQETGTVARLRVVNRSGLGVFLMSGEIVTGGRQDRTVRRDVLLPPHSPPIDVPVYCVEKGRWAGKTTVFGSPDQLGHLELRRQAQTGASQEAIWIEVDRKSREVGTPAPGGKFATVVDSPKLRALRREIVAKCVGLFPPGTVGVVCCRAGRIVAADCFANPVLFQALQRKLLGSYVLDLVKTTPHPFHPEPLDFQVRRLLRNVLAARLIRQPTPGAGYAVTLSHHAVSGHALLETAGLVHMQLFPAGR